MRRGGVLPTALFGANGELGPRDKPEDDSAGRLKGGRHIKMDSYTPLSNLMISLLDIAGVPTDKFGESWGRVEL